MATFYLQLTPTITMKELRAKFRAFELLYGESEMILHGDVVVEYSHNAIAPVSFVRGIIIDTSKRERFEVTETGRVDNPLNPLTAFLPHAAPIKLPHALPEIMFITKR